MKQQRPLHGLVLAGGRSSRMGQDKATLVHPDGRTLIRRCCDLLRQASCDSIVISLRYDQEIPVGFEEGEIVRDPEGASLGPIAGIISGIKRNPDDDWIVLACDLPRLDLATLAHLIAAREHGERRFIAYRSESDGLPEPLCALYASGTLEVLQKAQAEDFRCPRKILILNDCRLLEPVTPRALENANTPEDWKTAVAP